MSSFPSAWLRAVLPMSLLELLAQGESYGYALLQQLQQAGLPVQAPVLYPALARLEEQGDVQVRWTAGVGGPGRKYYSLSQQGRARLDVEHAAWQEFTTAIRTLQENQ